MNMTHSHRYAICVKNRGHAAGLEVRKVYRVVPDTSGERRRLLRVIDESGEDYLYPASYFLPIELPPKAEKVFSRKSA